MQGYRDRLHLLVGVSYASCCCIDVAAIYIRDASECQEKLDLMSKTRSLLCARQSPYEAKPFLLTFYTFS